MRLGKHIRTLTAITVGLGILGIGTHIYNNHNIVYTTAEGASFQKVDGPFATTQVGLGDLKSVTMDRYDLFGKKRYFDREGDNSVDAIVIESQSLTGEPTKQYFYRSIHGDTHQAVFEKADYDFKMQMARFLPLIKRYEL